MHRQHVLNSLSGPERVRGRRVTVIGMARSGLAAARLIARHGGAPFVSDASPPARLAAAMAELEQVGVTCETGGHTDRVLDADFVVVSPGVPIGSEVVRLVRDRGLAVYSEVELAWWFCQVPVVAVTGSNGKTTTTTLIGRMFEAASRPGAVCGNIGRAFADVVDDIPADGVAVVEVSSFQLETVATFRPAVALILNLQPDHLDRHGSFEAYAAAKYRIAECQRPDDVLVVNADDAALRAASIATAARRLSFSIELRDDAAALAENGQLVLTEGARRPILPVADIRLPGRHNLANAAAAALAAACLGVPDKAIADTLRAFAGVPHRLEPLGEVGGVASVNDSKATNVDATCTALAAMTRPTVLILGGRHKGAPYTPISGAGQGRLIAVIAIGESRERIATDLAGRVPVTFAGTLEEAVRSAYVAAQPGGVVLLSPACASFDMFTDFEARGRAFAAAVAELARESPG